MKGIRHTLTYALLLMATGISVACGQQHKEEGKPASTTSHVALDTDTICEPEHDAEEPKMLPMDSLHKATNSVYYWRTTYNPSARERAFMRRHRVGRMYLRMFDVVGEDNHTVPNATLKFKQKVPKGMEIVPTVFITVEALQATGKSETAALARKIVTRVERMCDWNDIDNWTEIQLDCDWTGQTRDAFYALCREVKAAMPQGKLLSSTIRLHQLAQKEPPVDYGVLMVYNTDDFRNPSTHNSILNDSTVEKFVKRKQLCRLPLDVALPIFEWSLVFSRDGQFLRLASESSHAADEVVKHEHVPYTTLQRTQALLQRYLDLGHHSTILYHLDEKNINRYSHEQIKSLYTH